MDRLPPAYAAGLRLERAGLPEEEIAAQLGIDITAVPQLLVVGYTKLAALLAEGRE